MNHNFYRDEYFESLTESDAFGGIRICEADNNTQQNSKVKKTSTYKYNNETIEKSGPDMLSFLTSKNEFKGKSGLYFVNANGFLYVNDISWVNNSTSFTNLEPAGTPANYNEFVERFRLDPNKNNWVFVDSKVNPKLYKELYTELLQKYYYSKDPNATNVNLDRMRDYLKSGKKTHWAYVTGDKVSTSVKFKGTAVINSISNAIGVKTQLSW